LFVLLLLLLLKTFIQISAFRGSSCFRKFPLEQCLLGHIIPSIFDVIMCPSKHCSRGNFLKQLEPLKALICINVFRRRRRRRTNKQKLKIVGIRYLKQNICFSNTCLAQNWAQSGTNWILNRGKWSPGRAREADED
jgi:hypothetical protein